MTWNTCLICGKKAKTSGAKFCSACYERKRLYGRATYITERHGAYDTPEYKIYSDMKKRCNSLTHHAYKDYGGRGIKVCESWVDSFEAFISDMGLRPNNNLTLERKDNDGDYTPDNCIWATRQEQSQNMRSTRLNSEAVKVIRYMYKTKQKSQVQLAIAYNISMSLVSLVCTGKRWGNVA